jgi:aminopeptidase YwaD
LTSRLASFGSPLPRENGGSRCAALRALAIGVAILSLAGVANAEVLEAELRRDVRYLASDELAGRFTGSVGHWKAAQYIADRFQRLGLSAVGGDGYLQHFGFPQSVAMGDSTCLTWGDASWSQPSDVLPLGHSAAGGAEGEIVFVGYGADTLNSEKGSHEADLTGRIALVLSGAPDEPSGRATGGTGRTSRAKVAEAANQGAAAVILVRTNKDGPDDVPLPFDPTARGGSIPAVALSRSAALECLGAEWESVFAEDPDAIAQRLGKTVGHGTIHADLREIRTETANVAGLLRGSDPDLMWEYVVVGAHYDHIGIARDGRVNNGADDNASGVSGLLALAQEFAARRDRPRRSILFIAFSGEELGLLGSRHYVANPLVPLIGTRAMINLDMVGRLRNNTVMVLGADSGSGMADLVEHAALERGIDVTFGGRAPAGSDHVPFLGSSIPSVFMFTGTHPQYHTPDDDWQLLNYVGMSQVLNMTADLLEALANADSVPTWVPPPQRGFLGVVPTQSRAVGFTIASVVAGSAAAKAGLVAGDVIKEFNGKPVENAAALIRALSRLSAGAEVSLVVERGEERYQCTATLGPAP